MKILKTVALVLGVVSVLVTGFAAVSTARVDVNIGVNLPLPVYVAPAPPPVVVIPNSYVYYVPDVNVDILFYHGYWYRPHEGRWFRSQSYNGPWHRMSSHRVPRALVSLPPNYRHVPAGYRHIPHRDLKKNWSKWEKERYWHRHGWGDERHRGGPDRGPKGRDFDDRGHGRGHGR